MASNSTSMDQNLTTSTDPVAGGDTGNVEQQGLDAKINSLSDNLFQKTANYVKAELEVTLDDYRLLEAMNKSAAEKYRSMSGLSENVAQSVSELSSSYEQLTPYLEKIDALDEKVTRLEELAYAVDSYSKRLETRFKALEKSAPKN